MYDRLSSHIFEAYLPFEYEINENNRQNSNYCDLKPATISSDLKLLFNRFTKLMICIKFDENMQNSKPFNVLMKINSYFKNRFFTFFS